MDIIIALIVFLVVGAAVGWVIGFAAGRDRWLKSRRALRAELVGADQAVAALLHSRAALQASLEHALRDLDAERSRASYTTNKEE